jgi:hypothetical protein
MEAIIAIDSAEKRRSIAHIARRWSGAGVTPNASQDVNWRQEAGRGYPGIAASGTPPADGVDQPGMILLLDMSI